MVNLIIPSLSGERCEDFFLSLTKEGALLAWWGGAFHETYLEGGELRVVRLSEQTLDYDDSYRIWLVDDFNNLYRVDIQLDGESESFEFVHLMSNVVDFTTSQETFIAWNEKMVIFSVEGSPTFNGIGEFRNLSLEPPKATKYWFNSLLDRTNEPKILFATATATYLATTYLSTEGYYIPSKVQKLFDESTNFCVKLQGVDAFLLVTVEGDVYRLYLGDIRKWDIGDEVPLLNIGDGVNIEKEHFPWPVGKFATSPCDNLQFVLTKEGQLFWKLARDDKWSLLLDDVSSFLLRESDSDSLVVIAREPAALVTLTTRLYNHRGEGGIYLQPGEWIMSELTSPELVALDSEFCEVLTP